MSTILRALKKLEHEKTSRKPDPADIDLEFLSSSPSTPAPRRSPLKGVFVIALLLACGSAGTYLFMTRTEKKPVPIPRPAAPQARQAIPFKTATSALSSTVALANRSSAASPRTTSTPQTQTQAQTQAQQKPAPATLAMQPAKTPPESLPKQVSLKKQRLQQIAKTPKAPIRNTSSTSLTVNGIALSDGEKRKAIVNGMSVSVGSVVEGARIEDIQENRVRFSRGNRKFEISVGNSGS
jgi:general secretion pathway protein B